LGRRTLSPFDPSSIPTCVDDRFQLWTLFGGPPQWIPWLCGPTVFDGSTAANPLPLVDLEYTEWRANGNQSRWLGRYPREPLLSSLTIRHQLPALTSGLATFGADFILPPAPVVLAGTLTTITTGMIAGTDPFIRLDLPLGTGTVSIVDT